MKNSDRILFVFVFTLLVTFSFYIGRVMTELAGDPTLKKESKEIVAEYLQKNYPEIPFTIKDRVVYVLI